MFILFAFFLAAWSSVFALNEAQVFEWWDNEIITPEEANEILLLLDEGNEGEACLLTEVYAQYSCEGQSDADSKSKAPNQEKNKDTKKGKSGRQEKKDSKPSLKPYGYFVYKTRLDSNGRMVSHREELLVNFYRYRLRLGSQELLTYSNKGSEAHFGDISTKEIHSHIPLDTLWGTILLYPVGSWYIGGLLDSSKTTQGKLGLNLSRSSSVDISYWHREGSRSSPHATANHSIALQTKMTFGQISGWWQMDQSTPLIKIQLHESRREQGTHQGEGMKLGWRTTAYYHEDSVPALAHLSSTILNSRLWGSQTITAAWPQYAHTNISIATRLLNPLHTDSVSVRLKISAQGGPEFLRLGGSTTCLEANSNCRETDWKGSADFRPLDQWTFGGSAKVRYTRKENGEASEGFPTDKTSNEKTPSGFGNPRLEASVLYEDSPRNYAKLSLVAADGNPTRRLQVQNEIHLNAGFLDFSLVNTFARTPTRDFHPTRASFIAKVLF